MLASDPRFLGELAAFCTGQVDLYVFDYRGTGLSGERAPSLGRIIADYREIAADVAARYPSSSKHLYYGISGGGVLLLNALSLSGRQVVVLDGVPDRLTVRCWQRAYNPVRRIPRNAEKIMVLAGRRDRTTPVRKMRELVRAVVAGGGTPRTADLPHFDRDSAADRRLRARHVTTFFVEKGS